MPGITLDPQHPAAQIRGILRQLDRELHEVIDYTGTRDFDPLTAAELMGRFGQAYQTLGYHRFTGLLLSMDELRQASPDEPEEASTVTNDPQGIDNHDHTGDQRSSESIG